MNPFRESDKHHPRLLGKAAAGPWTGSACGLGQEAQRGGQASACCHVAPKSQNWTPGDCRFKRITFQHTQVVPDLCKTEPEKADLNMLSKVVGMETQPENVAEKTFCWIIWSPAPGTTLGSIWISQQSSQQWFSSSPPQAGVASFQPQTNHETW